MSQRAHTGIKVEDKTMSDVVKRAESAKYSMFESVQLVPELVAEIERLRAAIERVREVAHNPETYSGTGVVTVTPRRILAALETDR